MSLPFTYKPSRHIRIISKLFAKLEIQAFATYRGFKFPCCPILRSKLNSKIRFWNFRTFISKIDGLISTILIPFFVCFSTIISSKFTNLLTFFSISFFNSLNSSSWFLTLELINFSFNFRVIIYEALSIIFTKESVEEWIILALNIFNPFECYILYVFY